MEELNYIEGVGVTGTITGGSEAGGLLDSVDDPSRRNLNLQVFKEPEGEAEQTWVIVHGWDSSPEGENIEYLIDKTVSAAGENDRVLALDWSEASNNEGSSLREVERVLGGGNGIAATWIAPTAEFAVRALAEFGINSSNAAEKLNLIGHSLGSFVSSEIGRIYRTGSYRRDNEFDSAFEANIEGVRSVTALDPASPNNLPGGGYDIDFEIDDRQAPNPLSRSTFFSRSFVGFESLAGSPEFADTAKEAYEMVFTENEDEKHGAVVEAFANIFDSSQGIGDFLGYDSYQSPEALPTDNFDEILETRRRLIRTYQGFIDVNDDTNPTRLRAFSDTEANNQIIVGDFLPDEITGEEGDDILNGGGENDTAVFGDDFENYKYEINPTTEEITFDHVQGTQTDGRDTLTNIEFAQFEDRLVPLPLEDGPEDTEEADLLNADGESEGTASLTLPTYTYDGDADYTFTLSTADTSSLYNFAFIIDTSGSMDTNDDGTPNNKLTNAKAAYTNLTNYLTEEDIASEFAVIPFSNSASLSDALDARQTISTIDGLSAGGDTNFNAALAEANSFFSGANPNAANIAYFLSDGMNTEGDFGANAADLQRVADVRAFGIGDADIGQLNIIDSNNAVLLADSSDLEEEFTTTSGLPLDSIERIDIVVDTDANDNVEGEVIQTIQPNQLEDDSSAGLRFTGSIEDLDVAIDAENLVTAEVVFNDGRPNTTVDFIVTAGQGIGSATDGDDDIRMGATDIEIDAGAGNDTVLGNYLDNTLAGGSGNDRLIASDGDDTIIPGEGDDLIEGGEGIDTVVYSGTREEEGGIRQVADKIEVGSNTDTLLDVEFVEFSDVTVNTEDLTTAPVTEERSDTINGTDENDTLTGTDENDVLVGYDGDDFLEGLDGEDELDGGMGDDSLEGGQQNDTLAGGDGEDTLRGSGGADELFGGDGNDELKGSSGNDRSFGGSGNDLLFGGSDNDELFGDDDDDTLFGGIGSDSLDGGSGNDRLLGVNSDTDELFGRSTIDTLTGGGGSNTFVLGEGDDVFYDSGISDNLGTNDYALITDFQLGQDSLELAGSRSDYSFGLTSDDLLAGLAVYHQPGTGDRELIAVLQSDNLLATSEDIESAKAALEIDNFVDSSLEI